MRYANVESRRRWRLKAIIIFIFAQVMSGALNVARALEPQPDPAGIATGDKSSVADAAGNPLVVPEPAERRLPITIKTRRLSTTTRRRRPGNRSR